MFGEDPTVRELQERVAGILGKEAALYVPSGTMGNQICIKVHTQAGDEVIAERGSHVFNYETAGAAFLSSVQVHPVEGVRGVLGIEEVRQAIRPKLYYMPRTRLSVRREHAQQGGGHHHPLESLAALSAFAHGGGAEGPSGRRAPLERLRRHRRRSRAYAAHADSVSVCLSKGLGAPVGSVIAGTTEFIQEARHYRKIFGGGMRQAGVIAAAGLYALENNRERLHEDHEKARCSPGLSGTSRGSISTR